VPPCRLQCMRACRDPRSSALATRPSLQASQPPCVRTNRWSREESSELRACGTTAENVGGSASDDLPAFIASCENGNRIALEREHWGPFLRFGSSQVARASSLCCNWSRKWKELLCFQVGQRASSRVVLPKAVHADLATAGLACLVCICGVESIHAEWRRQG
jgi:hypothetical protein